MKTSAKLKGLGTLIDQLTRKIRSTGGWWCSPAGSRRRPRFRHSSKQGAEGRDHQWRVGAAQPGDDQAFLQDPPECHVIVSTEAGSEGVNLQVANVLVNYDLPWNPMIVEQRIGRVQRLASEHASVSILNIMLKDTFEEYIVGRLMEKLQMAAHAIGDLEALLEASGIDDEDGEDFDDKSCVWCWRRSPARTSKRPRARPRRVSSRPRPSCKRKKQT